MCIRDRNTVKLCYNALQGTRAKECYKRDSFITRISFVLEKHKKNTQKSGNNDFMIQKSSKFDEKTDKFTFWLKNIAKNSEKW